MQRPSIVPALRCAWQPRILVSRRRHDEVAAALVEAVRALSVGDPMDPSTMVGPLVTAASAIASKGTIRIARDQGARVACGGGRPKGYVGFEPTLA